MNQNKIDDLMYQAGLTAQGCWDEMDDYAKQEIEKFAELIVRECIKSLGSQTDQSNLRKKFGIAEPTVEGIGRYYPPPDINSAESQYDRRARIENNSKQQDFKKNIKEAFKNGADLSNQDTP